jgi:methionyl-tRNA formyltransferase
VETLDRLAAGQITPEKQDSAQATLAPILRKEDGRIDWTQPAESIHNRARGFQPWPGAYTTFRGQAFHVWRSKVAAGSGIPGQVISRKPLAVACGSGSLEPVEVQLEGRKRIAAADFVNGQRVTEGEKLGE